MHDRPTQPFAADHAPRAQPMKFAFASGARPLDGYTIKRGIGRGGFGEVYYATSDGGKEVALKLIRRNLDIELRGVAQCLNLKHPHLLALYDIRRDDEDNIWVVMEYVAGETLDQVIDRNPQGLPVPEVLAWIHGIGAGVAYLHDRGIVHRDLKPGNVFCDEGVVKLGDYGLSKFISASRRSGQTESVGTVHYMAPEVANGRYGKEIDIYALGIVLYEMLTGRVPFEGESVGEVLMKHLTAQPALDGLSEPFRTVVARALDKDPDTRFQSVEEFLSALPQPVTPEVRVNPQAVKPPVVPEFATSPAKGQPAAAQREPPIEADIADDSEHAAPPRDHRVQDPVWIAVRDLFAEIRRAWRDADLSTPWRVVFIILGIFVLISGSGFIITALVLGAIFYVIYRILWSLGWVDPQRTGRVGSEPRSRPEAHADRPAGSRADRPDGSFDRGRHPAEATRQIWHEGVRQTANVWREWIDRAAVSPREQAIANYLNKTAREKAADLIGSLLLSATVAVVFSALMLLGLNLYDSEQLLPAQFAWLAIVSTVGAWGILIPSKFWERATGEVALRRFVLLIVGLLVGVVGYALDVGLMVGLPYANVPWIGAASHELARPWRSVLFDTAGGPTLSLYITYFGALFPVLRWWKLADIRRSHRFRIWSVAGCALWAYILSELVEFPPSWGPIAAATIASAVQLASPWFDPKTPRAPCQAA